MLQLKRGRCGELSLGPSNVKLWREKAYGMNVLTPMPVRMTWINVLIFMASRVFPGTLGSTARPQDHPFLPGGSWSRRHQWPAGDRGAPRLKYDYMLFCSNFNGTWDQYIDAFADGLPSGWTSSGTAASSFPHSIPITPFKKIYRLQSVRHQLLLQCPRLDRHSATSNQR